jgi:hypothetical protein
MRGRRGGGGEEDEQEEVEEKGASESGNEMAQGSMVSSMFSTLV